MNKLLISLLTTALALTGCQSKPPAPVVPPSVPMDAAGLEQLRTTLGGQPILASVDRVLPSDDFLSLVNANTADFVVGVPVSVIDSNANTLAHGSVAAIVGGEVHVQFTVVGPRRPQTGDAVIAFPRH